jgi:hypothetical protein
VRQRRKAVALPRPFSCYTPSFPADSLDLITLPYRNHMPYLLAYPSEMSTKTITLGDYLRVFAPSRSS